MPAGDEVPQLLGRGDAAGIAAAHADDGDGFVGLGLHLVQPLASLRQVGRDPPEVVAKLLLVLHLGQPLRRWPGANTQQPRSCSSQAWSGPLGSTTPSRPWVDPYAREP